jgi:O-antigen biosynthesis rhamnosyltransferase
MDLRSGLREGKDWLGRTFSQKRTRGRKRAKKRQPHESARLVTSAADHVAGGKRGILKVLHFFKTYFPDSFGGIEQFIYQLARGSVQRGIDVDVLSLSSNVIECTRMVDNHRSHRVKLDFEISSTGVSLAAISRFNELAREADLVHYHFPWPFMDLVHFASRIDRPTIVTYHSDILRQRLLLQLYKPLMRRFLTDVDRIVATSPNYLETSPTLNSFRHKTTVIPIGLDRLSYRDASCELIQKWRGRVGHEFFLFVGMLRYYKGLHILLDAVRNTDLRVVIAGSGPTELELKKHAQRLGLRNVLFLGSISDEDKVALLQLSLAVVFPSHLRAEAFGISMLEGAMFGKPMISSEIGTGTSFVNVDGETGFVVPPEDPVAFRTAMQTLRDHSSLASAMGRNAEARYRRHFTAQLMVNRYMTLYNNVL